MRLACDVQVDGLGRGRAGLLQSLRGLALPRDNAAIAKDLLMLYALQHRI